jgi:YEATS domain-containing protein 4
MFPQHRWTVFVRGPNDEDLSTFVSQVCFSLHPSFAQPLRIIKTPPFEVTECGWGEFEILIRLIFNDPTEQPIDLIHLLKLYPDLTPTGPGPIGAAKRLVPVMSEHYDEIVFFNPHENFFGRCLNFRHTKNKIQVPHLKVMALRASFQHTFVVS